MRGGPWVVGVLALGVAGMVSAQAPPFDTSGWKTLREGSAGLRAYAPCDLAHGSKHANAGGWSARSRYHRASSRLPSDACRSAYAARAYG